MWAPRSAPPSPRPPRALTPALMGVLEAQPEYMYLYCTYCTYIIGLSWHCTLLVGKQPL